MGKPGVGYILPKGLGAAGADSLGNLNNNNNMLHMYQIKQL